MDKELLRHLITEKKFTYDQAASHLGVTRNAVAGAASRMGISSGRKHTEFTEEGLARISAARNTYGFQKGNTIGRENLDKGRTSESNRKSAATRNVLSPEELAHKTRLEKAATAFRGLRRGAFAYSDEKKEVSLPKLKFMEGPGPEDE